MIYPMLKTVSGFEQTYNFFVYFLQFPVTANKIKMMPIVLPSPLPPTHFKY